MEGEKGEVQMANYSPAWRAHAAGARLVQCLQGLGRGRGLDALGSRGRSKSGPGTKTQRRGQIAAAKKKKRRKRRRRKKKKQLANWVPSVPALQTNVAVQVWAAGAASRLTDFSPTDFRKKNRKTRKKHGTHQSNSTFKPSWGRPSLTT